MMISIGLFRFDAAVVDAGLAGITGDLGRCIPVGCSCENLFMNLPDGVALRPLDVNRDLRGSFTEVFREEWGTGISPVQWNIVSSEAGTLRGVHVHIRHDDYLTTLRGRASVGLRDLRRGSPTEGMSALVELAEDPLTALLIPHGVAHGFFFAEPSLHLYGVTKYWDVGDELACHWADPQLEIPWPALPTLVSERDSTAPSLAELLDELEPSQPFRTQEPLVASS
jgi:dTDP-4-dehydrorhamnose 3,5-epimerase